MKVSNLVSIAIVVCCAVFVTDAQVLKRTTTKTESIPIGPGSTFSIMGAPMGDISVEAAAGSTVELTATIEVQAMSEADLAGAAALTGYVTQEELGRVGIVSIGSDTRRKFTNEEKKLIKRLQGLPYRIDYTVKLPKYTSVEIDGGVGKISLFGTEGQHKIKGVDSDLRVTASGSTFINLMKGKVHVELLGGTRFEGIDASVVSGDIDVLRFHSVSGDVDASVLRTGKILNNDPELREIDKRKFPFSEKLVKARAGAGGTGIKLTVGDGNISLQPLVQ